jgi:PAS domain S-box-containing protein
VNPKDAGLKSVRIAEGSALVAAGIGAVGLAGWLVGRSGLARWTSASVPIAPVTALALALLGTAVFSRARWPERRTARRAAAIAAIAVAALSLLVLAQFVAGFDLGLERPLVRTVDAALDAAGARVSPLTALALLLSAVSLIDQLAFPVGARAGRRAGAVLGMGIVAIALTVVAGYALGRPPLYGGAVQPVALATASALALLGTALVAAALASTAEAPADGRADPTFRRPGLTRHMPMALAVIAGLLLSGVLATIVSRLEEARQREDFARRADNAGSGLRATVDRVFDAVADVHDLLLASPEVHRDAFREFATAELAHGAEVLTLAWVPRVADQDRTAIEGAARREGASGFRFTELDARGRIVPAARRAAYYPVLYLQSKQDSQVALGFDLAWEPARRATLERAGDGGSLAASGPLALLVPGRPTGLVLAYPVYRRGAPIGDVPARRAALTGFAVGAVRMGDLIAAVRRTVRSSEVSLELLDVSDPAHPAVLYADAQAPAGRDLVVATTTLRLGGRAWLARMRPTAAYLGAQRTEDAWLVFVGGLLLTLLIAAHLYSLERYSAEVEASHAALAESEGRFRAIAESAADGIITVDAIGTIVHCNAAAMRAFGYVDGDLLGRNVRDLVPASHVAAHTAGLDAYRATGRTRIGGEALELPALRRDGSEFPIELSLATWETHEGRFATAILRNVSERKVAQEDRERLIGELQEALSNVKTLSGLLPVCSWCHKVLDDRGAWRQMEAYVHEHTDADFSHGICPDCAKKHMGEDG